MVLQVSLQILETIAHYTAFEFDVTRTSPLRTPLCQRIERYSKEVCSNYVQRLKAEPFSSTALRSMLPDVMAMVRVFNPSLWPKHSTESPAPEVPGNPKPRKNKTLTREQIAKRQDKAVQFLRHVADDPEHADEIDDLSIEEYAERKGFEVASNPSKRRKPMKAEQLKELMSEAAKAGASEALRQNRRANPNGQTAPPTAATRTKLDKDKIIDRVDDAAAAIADGDDDEALDIMNGLLDDYGDDDD